MTKRTLQTVCVYCGSSNTASKNYFDMASQVGKILAKNGMDIIYGGGHVGLMGTVADSALIAGGNVTGIIPHHLFVREVQHEGLTRLIVVDNMHERKAKMVEQSDAFVILPGGFGTMDETFEIITWKQLGLHDKPVILLNFEGYWDPFVSLAQNIVAHNFATSEDMNLFTVVEGTENLINTLDKAIPQSFEADLSSI